MNPTTTTTTTTHSHIAAAVLAPPFDVTTTVSAEQFLSAIVGVAPFRPEKADIWMPRAIHVNVNPDGSVLVMATDRYVLAVVRVLPDNVPPMVSARNLPDVLDQLEIADDAWRLPHRGGAFTTPATPAAELRRIIGKNKEVSLDVTESGVSIVGDAGVVVWARQTGSVLPGRSVRGIFTDRGDEDAFEEGLPVQRDFNADQLAKLAALTAKKYKDRRVHAIAPTKNPHNPVRQWVFTMPGEISPRAAVVMTLEN